MYPIATFADNNNILDSTFSMPNSFLRYRNWGSKYSESVEIDMPYMILYESISKEKNRAIYFEFTEANQNSYYNDFSFIATNGERPLHYHNFYELTIVLSGKLDLQIENEVRSYYPGDCCICNKNIRHKEITDGEYEIVLLMLTEDYLKTMLDGDYVFDKHGNKTHRNTFFYRLFQDNEKNHFFDAKEYIEFTINNDHDSSTYFELLNNMVLRIRDNFAGKSYQMQAYLCSFIDMLEDSALFQINTNWAKLSNDDMILFKVAELLENNPHRISVQFIEEKVGYNGDYINRIIKRRTGKTLSLFCRDYILEIATDELKNTDKSISEICENLGYTNRNFFNKIFTETYGVTPYQYRKNHMINAF